MLYIVIVFFASGSISGPAHFEQDWWPRPMANIEMCRMVGQAVLNQLETDPTLNGEAYQVACITAEGPEQLAAIIKARWTFEDPPAPPAPADPA